MVRKEANMNTIPRLVKGKRVRLSKEKNTAGKMTNRMMNMTRKMIIKRRQPSRYSKLSIMDQ